MIPRDEALGNKKRKREQQGLLHNKDERENVHLSS